MALKSAREKYVVALHKTGKALRDPSVAATDSTLLSTLLLDLFEKLSNASPHDANSYTSHVSGALALVKLRGVDSFRDPFAARMLMRIHTNLLISCIASGTRVPEGLNVLRSHVALVLDIKDIEDPKWQLSSLTADYANLRADAAAGQAPIENLVDRTEALDAQLLALYERMPDEWRFKTTILEAPSNRVYQKRFDVYRDRHTTQTSNVARLIRILLNESLIEYYASIASDQSHINLVEKTHRPIDIIKTLAAEICYSAPQFMDCLAIAKAKLTLRLDAHRENSLNHSPVQGLDCYSLILPFYVSARSPYVAEDLRTWVIDQLHYMADHFGIQNAQLVGQIIERRQDVPPWTLYAMLGSYAFAA
ncbi:hypothetical protein NA57DRAFT_75173 [Rhizodiscina lignyota]|uniref:Uncharacterized protein n=1 Tax=Rhizodiscina lignyota TaxID=1504668 RepID=A0A9P4M767_9PEZI|nr:hypothetical protein NA57DRAFT_75173 [Rhizodiscina lignyota]